MANEDSVCNLDLDTHTDMVLELLPRGRAWPREPDTTMYKFWRSFATVVKYLEDEACAVIDEFFCDTATARSLDIWQAQYGLPDECDPSGQSLCSRVAAQGGGTADYFRRLGEQIGYTIFVTDLSANPSRAGGMVCGCTKTGPKAKVFGTGSNLGYMQAGACAADEYGAGGTFAGDQGTPSFGNYTGHAHCWNICVDVGKPVTTYRKTNLFRASGDFGYAGDKLGEIEVLSTSPTTADVSTAGCFYAGDRLEDIKFREVFCFIERYKPAHTILTYSFC